MHPIAIHRKKNNLTQPKLGLKIGLSTSSIAAWEIGVRRPKPSMLAKVASALGVRTDLLDVQIAAWERRQMAEV